MIFDVSDQQSCSLAADPRTRLNHLFYTECLERLRRRQQSCCYREVSSAVSLLLGSGVIKRIYIRSFQLTSREYKRDPMNKGEKHPLPSFILCRQTDYHFHLAMVQYASNDDTLASWWLSLCVCFPHSSLSWCPNSVRFLYKTKRNNSQNPSNVPFIITYSSHCW